MSEITPAQVHDLLTATQEYITTADAANDARTRLDHILLDTARSARIGLKQLSVITGLHHSTIRAGIQRAAGPILPDGWEQIELDFTPPEPRDVIMHTASVTPSSRPARQDLGIDLRL
jgi:hypothetical protein